MGERGGRIWDAGGRGLRDEAADYGTAASQDQETKRLKDEETRELPDHLTTYLRLAPYRGN